MKERSDHATERPRPGTLIFTDQTAPGHGRLLRATVAFALAVFMATLAACGGETPEPAEMADDPDEEAAQGLAGAREMPEPPAERTTSPAERTTSPDTGEVEQQQPQTATRQTGSQGQAMEGSGEPVWAEGAPGQLIAGLNGENYDAYNSETIEAVQGALADQGMYSGPVNGILDRPTMDAIGRFQEMNNLTVSGVPSPRTRELLLDESNPQ